MKNKRSKYSPFLTSSHYHKKKPFRRTSLKQDQYSDELIDPLYFFDLQWRSKPANLIQRVESDPVEPNDRDYIVCSIFAICACLDLSTETWHLFVSLLDRYMACQPVHLKDLELIAVTCLWIAAKFNETQEFLDNCGIKDCLQSRQFSGNWEWVDMLDMEVKILMKLHYRILTVTIYNFLQREIRRRQYTDEAKVHTACYFVNLTCLKYEFQGYSMDILVEAILFLAFQIQTTSIDSNSNQLIRQPAVRLLFEHMEILKKSTRKDQMDSWSIIRCVYASCLPKPWQIPLNNGCHCSICLRNQK